MSTTSAQIKINVYRPLEGLRTPYTITLDQQRNVVSDEIDVVELAHIKATPSVLARHTINSTPEAQHAALLAKHGLYKHVTETGIVISKDKPDAWALSFEDWQDKGNPNPFAGTDALRLEFFQELADVQARIAGGTCPGCELNRLQVSYRTRLRELEAA